MIGLSAFACQAPFKEAKSRQDVVLLTGRTQDLPGFAGNLPESAGIHRHIDRPQ